MGVSRREQILEAALRLFRRYGFRKTTVDEIASEAGIGKGSVYLEFPSKEDVFFALLEEHEKGILAEVQRIAAADGDVCQRLTDVALVRPGRNHVEMEQLPEAFEMLAALRGRLADRVRPCQEQCVQVVADLVREGCGHGRFLVADVEAAARTFYSAFDVSFVFAMHGMDEGTMESVLRSLARLLITGLSGEGN